MWTGIVDNGMRMKGGWWRKTIGSHKEERKKEKSESCSLPQSTLCFVYFGG